MSLLKDIKALFAKNVDEKTISELQILLLSRDVSHKVSHHLISKIKKANDPLTSLRFEIGKILKAAETKFECTSKPFVIFIYGVNGSGKTTTITKLANLLQNQGKKVLVAACDTFRAAAADQLSTALAHIGCKTVSAENDKSDPASVAFIASKQVLEEGYDVLIVDTAGRLHTNENLMAELSKIHKVVIKNLPNSGYLNIAIMDAMIGQNSIAQIQKFNHIVPISGVIITKLDTSAKGGALISVIYEMQKKVYFTCTGSKLGDIQPFNADDFSKAFIE